MIRKQEQGSFIIPLLVIGIVLILGGLAFAYFSKTTKTVQVIRVVPTTPTNDYAPNLPMSQKTTITVRDTDSSTEKIIVPKNQANKFIKNLPKGQTVISTN